MMPEGRVCVGRDSSLSLGETVRVRVLDYSEKKENTLLFFHRPKFAPSPQPTPKRRGSRSALQNYFGFAIA
jgi:hypothetical protein